jgi:hypothetical protein
VFTLTVASGAGNTSNCLLTQAVALGSFIGKSLILQVEVLGATVGHGIQASIYNPTGPTNYNAIFTTTNDSDTASTLPYMILRSTPFVVPAGTTNGSLNIEILGTTGSIQIGRVELRQAIIP